ncbi:MAG: hypothetical protein LBT27_01075 [Prevotellaceae bacterium]|jgi:hypothetical protein|nr:hypothetical protein [Prevotellaceae bacterium]
MKNDENLFDVVVQKIKAQSPELHDSEGMTNRIMQKIDDKSATKNMSANRVFYFLKFVRIISSAAAVFLVGLFIFQQFNSEKIKPLSTQNFDISSINYQIEIPCFENDKEINFRQFYQCYIAQNSSKNKFINKYINN